METKTRKNCILDCRISDSKQASGISLEDQENICRLFAEKQDWLVKKVFSKVYSGRAEERKDFQEILEYIQEQKRCGTPIHYYVIKSIDRFTRDGSDTYSAMKKRLAKLNVELRDSYGTIQSRRNTLDHLGKQYDWSIFTPSEQAELHEATEAKKEIRNILTRMIGAEITYTRSGYHTGQANDGYINKKIMDAESKKKTIQVPDPERARFFTEMFRLRAEGVLSDPEIVDHINAMGYLSKKQNKWNSKRDKIIGTTLGQTLTVKMLQKRIQNPIYAGVKLHSWGDGQPIVQNYAGLVTIETFNQANKGKVYIEKRDDGKIKILYNHHPDKQVKRRQKYNPLFPYAKIIRCPVCSKPFKGSATKSKSGKYIPAYHCDRKINGKRHYIRIPKAQFEKEVERFLSRIKFIPEYKQSFSYMLKKKYRERESELLKQSATASHTVAELKSQKQSQVDAFVATQNPSIREIIEEKIEQLDLQIEAAKNVRNKMELQEEDIELFIQWVEKIMEHPEKILTSHNDLEAQHVLWKLVFDKLPTYENLRNGTPKLSFIFQLSDCFVEDKSPLVSQQGLEWNSIQQYISEWKQQRTIFPQICT